MSLGIHDRPSTSSYAPAPAKPPLLLWADLVLAAFGIGSAVAVGALLAWINLRFRIAIFAWWLWLLPVGAFLCGLAAGVGFSIGTRVLRRKPGTLATFSAPVVAAVGYIAIYYFEYRGIRVEGIPISSVIGFGEFFDAITRRSTFGFMGITRTGSLGVVGYLLALLHLAGFMFGGYIAVVIASAGDACDRCRRFLSTKSATAYGRTAAEAFPIVQRLAEQGHGVAALSYVEGLTEPESPLRLHTEISTCVPCAREFYCVTLAEFESVAVGYVPIGQESPPTEGWRPRAMETGAVDIATAAASPAVPAQIS